MMLGSMEIGVIIPYLKAGENDPKLVGVTLVSGSLNISYVY